MTWMEKARGEYPGWTDERIVDACCPLDYEAGRCPENEVRMLYCDECWAREVPEEWADKLFRPEDAPEAGGRAVPVPTDGDRDTSPVGAAIGRPENTNEKGGHAS